MRYIIASICCLGVAVLCVGCHERLPYKVVQIEGTLLYQGKPLDRVCINFEPVGEGRASTAMTGPDGKFVAEYTPQTNGIQVGKHRIYLNVPSDEISGIPKQFKEINAKYGYGNRDNPFEVKITKKDKNFVIDLP